MFLRSLIAAVAACLATTAVAAPRVLFDTEEGSILLELDDVRAPNTTNNLLRYVEAGFFDGLVFHRSIENFVIQSGRNDAQAQLRTPPFPAIASERNNGLSNTYGTIAMALSGSDINSGRNEFYINTGSNTHLDENFTVFGKVVYGFDTVEAIDARVTYSTQTPYHPTLIYSAVEVADGAFPLLDAHSGSWFDPANSGRGIVLEIAADPENPRRRIMIAYGYDYSDGGQVWFNGAMPYELGAHAIDVPMQITSGGQFGSAFTPGAVQFDTSWGTLHIEFSSCSEGTFTYSSSFGDVVQQLTRITTPVRRGCDTTNS